MSDLFVFSPFSGSGILEKTEKGKNLAQRLNGKVHSLVRVSLTVAAAAMAMTTDVNVSTYTSSGQVCVGGISSDVDNEFSSEWNSFEAYCRSSNIDTKSMIKNASSHFVSSESDLGKVNPENLARLADDELDSDL